MNVSCTGALLEVETDEGQEEHEGRLREDEVELETTGVESSFLAKRALVGKIICDKV